MKTLNHTVKIFRQAAADSKGLLAIGGLLVVIGLLSVFSASSPEVLSQRNVAVLLIISVLLVRVIFYDRSNDDLFRLTMTAVMPLVVAIILALFLIDPKKADWIAQEDGLIENGSFVLLLLGSISMAVAAYYFRCLKQTVVTAVSVLLAVIFFVLAGEEVSWLQRVIGIESNDFLQKHNMQGELNLHNFNTTLTSRLYALAGLVLLVAAPFYRPQLSHLLEKLGWSSLVNLLPSMWLAAPFSLAFGYVAGLQSPFYMLLTLVPLLVVIKLMRDDIQQTQYGQVAYKLAIMSLFVATGIVFAVADYGQLGVRYWMDAEFFIVLGIFVYGMNVLLRSKAIASVRG